MRGGNAAAAVGEYLEGAVGWIVKIDSRSTGDLLPNNSFFEPANCQTREDYCLNIWVRCKIDIN